MAEVVKKISGFPELLPRDRKKENLLIHSINNTFKLFGFEEIEVRAVESISSLLAKGETSKEVYLLSRLQNPEVDLTSSKQLGLHFDLTIPFARYVLENCGKLNFPFRRSSIGKVWRGERPQEGRFREFLQADVDIITQDNGQSSQDVLPNSNDIEIVKTVGKALEEMQKLGLPKCQIHINNRKLLQSAYRIFGIKDYEETLRTIDKIDKIGSDEVLNVLIKNGESNESATKCIELANIKTDSVTILENSLREVFGGDYQKLEGVAELSEFLESGINSVVVDLKIARGLDYYTGNVFETFVDGFENYGSVASGGRYESLTASMQENSKVSYPGVGMSIGVTRLMALMLTNELFICNEESDTDVLVLVNDQNSYSDSQKVCDLLRNAGVSSFISPVCSKFGKQIDFAAKRNIKHVVFIGDNGLSVKNIVTGNQIDFSSDDIKSYDDFNKITSSLN